MTGDSDGIVELDLCRLAEQIERRELSPVEVTRAVLARIEALDSKLNSYITVTAEAALGAAEAAEKAITAGYYLGPLHGVPIAIKDIVATKGDRTTSGSKILADNIPTEDATVAARLRSAGAIFVGKLNMHEFAYGVTNDNPHYGAARNPWNLDRSPGGSSGGSGAAVAARLCFGALGTDTGCSVRLPAAYNGISGMRPTIGRVSNHGVTVLAWTLDTVGPMTLSVEDAAVMLQVMAGYDEKDRQTANLPVPDYRRDVRRPLKGMRVALMKDFSLTELQPGVGQAVEAAVNTLREEGVLISEVAIPDLGHSVSALLTVDIAEPAAYHAEWLRQRPQDYGEDVRALLEQGEMYLATHYIQAQRYRTIVRDRFAEALRDVDAILTPTVPFTAPVVGETDIDIGEGRRLGLIPAVMKYNSLPPLAGIPGLSIPCGFAEDGLPVGLQLIGRAFDEGTLFRIGFGYQQATDWHRRIPPL